MINKDYYRGIRDDLLSYTKYCSKFYSIDKRVDKKKKDYLAVACIIKDEGLFIKEFVDFHLLSGVDRLYIFDNGSGDDTKNILQPYIDKGIVVYFYMPGRKMQFVAYRKAVRYCKQYTRWLALIDSDEFLFSPKGNLKDILKEYENEVAVGVNWVCFGPSGHDSRPKGLVIENYTETFAEKDHFFNRHIKSIVDPKAVESINSPHFCKYKGNRLAVNENHEVIDGNAANTPYRSCAFTDKNCVEKLRINHYITKSLEDLRNKGKRGYADGMPSNKFDAAVKRFEVPLITDRTIFSFIDRLKNSNQ